DGRQALRCRDEGFPRNGRERLSHRCRTQGQQLHQCTSQRVRVHVRDATVGDGVTVRDFLIASVSDSSGRAARMLAESPTLAEQGFATAVVLGDADRVRAALERDRGLATEVDADSGWTPLHAVCSSRWHHFDPARTDGLVAVAELLLDAGADLTANRRGWSPLGCAAAAASTSSPN